ncbi:hypothetical protein IFO70_09065 [Phormidium tenue FACHB-886]|nr:hypothetical protein [Phormidium tenue FACHB-886]
MVGKRYRHAIYFLLQQGYSTEDLSLVYLLAKGTDPLLSKKICKSSGLPLALW